MKMYGKKSAAGETKVCSALVKRRSAKWFLNVLRETEKGEVPLQSSLGRSPRKIARPHNEVEYQRASRQHADVRASTYLRLALNFVLWEMAKFDRSFQHFGKCIECGGVEAKRSAH